MLLPICPLYPGRYGPLEAVRKLVRWPYAFVTFSRAEDAAVALQRANGRFIEQLNPLRPIEVQFCISGGGPEQRGGRPAGGGGAASRGGPGGGGVRERGGSPGSSRGQAGGPDASEPWC